MNDQDGTLEQWREVAQGLAHKAEEATKLIKSLMDDLRKITEQRDRLFELSRKQHNILVENGIIDSEEIMQ